MIVLMMFRGLNLYNVYACKYSHVVVASLLLILAFMFCCTGYNYQNVVKPNKALPKVGSI